MLACLYVFICLFNLLLIDCGFVLLVGVVGMVCFVCLLYLFVVCYGVCRV